MTAHLPHMTHPNLFRLLVATLSSLSLLAAQTPPPGDSAATDVAAWELPSIPPAAPEGRGCGSSDPAFVIPQLGSAKDKDSSVYLHNGEFHMEETDLILPARTTTGVNWVRTYRSRMGRSTPMGESWDHSYNVYIEMPSDPNLDGYWLFDGTGRVHHMRPSLTQPGVFSEAGFAAELSQSPQGKWQVLFANGGAWSLRQLGIGAASGKLEAITDRNGNQIQLTYSKQGQLLSLLDSLGRVTTVAYSAPSNGRVTSVTGPSGRVWVYAYYFAGSPDGGDGDLASATTPAVIGTPNGNDFPLGKTTTYTYSQGQPDADLNHNLLTVINGEGQEWIRNVYGLSSYRFDRDRIVRQTLGSIYKHTDYRYFEVSAADSTQGATQITVINDRMGNVTHVSYDASNRVVRREQFTGRARAKMPTTLLRNRPTGKLRSSDPESFVTTYTWNADDRQTSVTYPEGNSTVTVFEFDLDPLAPARFRGNVRERRRNAGPLGGDQAQLVDLYEYALGHSGCCGVAFVTKHTDPRGVVTQHTYDSFGNRTATMYPVSGLVDQWAYNSFGQVVERTHPLTTSGTPRRDVYTYYSAGGAGSIGRLQTRVVDADNLALTTIQSYDIFGNGNIHIDARGYDSRVIYNALNQPMSSLSRESVLAAGDRGAVELTYDAADRLVGRRVRWSGEDAGPVDRWVSEGYTYDRLGRLRTQSTSEGGTVLTGQEYSYDANGALALQRRPLAVNGQDPNSITTFERDERGLLWREIRSPGTPESVTIEMDYDANGSRIGRTESSSLTVWGDTRRQVDGFGRQVLSTDMLTGTFEAAQYDAAGNRVEREVTGQLLVDGDLQDMVPLAKTYWAYDPLNRRIQTSLGHFDLVSQAAIGDGMAVSVTEWEGLSLVRAATDDEGGVVTHTYDTAHRRVQTVDARGNRVLHSLDKNGNSTQVRLTAISDLGLPDEQLDYFHGYDGRNRRTSTMDPTQASLSTTFNSRNHPTSQVDQRGNRHYWFRDPLGRIVRSEQVLTDTGDGTGNELPGRIVKTRSYDAADRLVSMTDANGNTSSFAYDSRANNTSTLLADGALTTRSYDGSAVVLVADANGTTFANTYAHARIAASTVVAGAGVQGQNEQYLWDGLGQMVAGTDDDSAVLMQWDSLGNMTGETLTIGTGAGAVSGTTSRVFNGLRAMTSLTYPNGRNINYQNITVEVEL